MDPVEETAALLRSFERYLRARNRAPRTIGNYLDQLRLAEAWMAAGGVLDEADVTAQLLAAAQRCGLDQREAERTIASARAITIKHPRKVPDRPLASLRTTPARPRGRRQRTEGRHSDHPEGDRER
jgi:hypothetical protein